MLTKSPKQYQLSLTGGEVFDSIPATQFAHFMLIWEDGNRGSVFEYQLPIDSFATTYTTKAGDPIKLQGDGRTGCIGRPADFAPSNGQTAADTVIKIREFGGAQSVINIIESVSEIDHQAVF